MKKILTLLLTVLMVVTMGVVNVSADDYYFNINAVASGKLIGAEYTWDDQNPDHEHVLFTVPKLGDLTASGNGSFTFKYRKFVGSTAPTDNTGWLPLDGSEHEIKNSIPNTYGLQIIMIDNTDTVVHTETYFNKINKKSPSGMTFTPGNKEIFYSTTAQTVVFDAATISNPKPAGDLTGYRFGNITVYDADQGKYVEYKGDKLFELGSTADHSIVVKAGAPAGDYNIQMVAQRSVSDTIHYAGPTSETTGDLKLKIKKATITPVITMSGYKYGETISNPTLTSANPENGNVSFYYSSTDAIPASNETVWTDTKTLVPSTDSYYMYVRVAETKNYAAGVSALVPFKVSKNDSEVTVGDINANAQLTYNADNQSLVTVTNEVTGDAKQTVKFKVVEGTSHVTPESYTDSKAEAKNAKTYTIFYNVEENAYYKGKTGVVTTTINPFALTVDWSNVSDKVYTGQDLKATTKPTVTLKGDDTWADNGIEVKYTDGTNVVTEYKNVGSYVTEVVLPQAPENYVWGNTNTSKTVKVTNATLTNVSELKLNKDGFINTNTTDAVISGSAKGVDQKNATVTYESLDTSIATVNATTGAITPVRAGSVTIRATYTLANHNTVTKDKVLEIKPVYVPPSNPTPNPTPNKPALKPAVNTSVR